MNTYFPVLTHSTDSVRPIWMSNSLHQHQNVQQRFQPVCARSVWRVCACMCGPVIILFCPSVIQQNLIAHTQKIHQQTYLILYVPSWSYGLSLMLLVVTFCSAGYCELMPVTQMTQKLAAVPVAFNIFYYWCPISKPSLEM